MPHSSGASVRASGATVRARRSRAAAAVAALLLASLTGCGNAPDGGAVIASNDAPGGGNTASSTSQAPSIYVVDCVDGNLVQRPQSLAFSCGDSASGMDGLTWSDWGGETAVAEGSYQQNECIPDCARGKVLRYPVRVRLGDVKPLKRDRVYSSATLEFTKGVPPGLDPGQTIPLKR